MGSQRPPLALLGFMAWRGLAQNHAITLLMILAVAVGAAFQIVNNANLRGYEQEVMRQGISVGFGDVRIRPQSGHQLQDVPALVAKLQARPEVIAVVPTLTLAGAVGGRAGFEDAWVIGVDANAPRKPYQLLRGEHLRPGDDAGVVIGSGLARRIGVDVGSELQVRVILMMRNDLVGEDAIGRYTMTVRGIAAGNFVAPSGLMLEREFLSSEIGSSQAASLILVHITDHWAAPTVAANIRAELGVNAIAWADDNPFLNAAVRSSSTVSSVSYAMVMIAVIIPVWALLYISVLHRQRQVALMSAVGFARGAIFATFVVQAIVVGLAGIALGGLGAFGLVQYFDGNPIFEMEGFVITPARSLRTFLEPALAVLAATVVAGVWPAYRASRLNPSAILRAGR